MGCPTRITDLRARLATVSRFEPVIAVLKAIHAGSVPKAEQYRTRFIREHFANIGAMFQDGRVPSYPRIKEAAQPSVPGPSPEWAEWFLGIVRNQDFDDRQVDDGVGSAFAKECDNYNAVFVQIPPRLLAKLGDDFEPRSGYEAVRVILKNNVPDADLDDVLRQRIEHHGGRSKLRERHTRLDSLKGLLRSPLWEVVWPDVGATVRRVERALSGFEREGFTDLAPLLDDVKQVVLHLLGEHCPPWLPQDGASIDPEIRQKLLDSVLPHPHLLSTNSFRTVIATALQPAEVPHDLIEEALRQLHDARELHVRKITYRGPGTQERNEAFFVPGPGPEPGSIETIITEDALLSTVRGVRDETVREDSIRRFLQGRNGAPARAMLRALNHPGTWMRCGASSSAFRHQRAKLVEAIPTSRDRFTATGAGSGCSIVYTRRLP